MMREFGLIGYPLTHSSSKIFFEEKFERENLYDCRFHVFPLRNVNEIFSLINTFIYLKGFAITIPHKQTIIPLLDEITAEAKEIGAVNCVKIINGKLFGSNTDVFGFERSFLPRLPAGANKALVLGTGGAAKAVEYILKKNEIDYLLVSRTIQNENTITYKDLSQKYMQEYPVIINASPIGMSPKDLEYPPIPYNFLTPANYLYDLVYKPVKTVFLQKGEMQGSIIKNGEEMLALQAEENWRIWNEE